MSQTFASMPKTAVENIQHLLTLGVKSTILDTVVVQLSTDFIIKIRQIKNVHCSGVLLDSRPSGIFKTQGTIGLPE